MPERKMKKPKKAPSKKQKRGGFTHAKAVRAKRMVARGEAPSYHVAMGMVQQGY